MLKSNSGELLISSSVKISPFPKKKKSSTSLPRGQNVCERRSYILFFRRQFLASPSADFNRKILVEKTPAGQKPFRSSRRFANDRFQLARPPEARGRLFLIGKSDKYALLGRNSLPSAFQSPLNRKYRRAFRRQMTFDFFDEISSPSGESAATNIAQNPSKDQTSVFARHH